MSTYLMYGKYNPGSLGKISRERTEKALNLIKENGGQIKNSYALFGDYDLLFIIYFTENKDAIKTSVELGNILDIRFTTFPAITIDEFDELF